MTSFVSLVTIRITQLKFNDKYFRSILFKYSYSETARSEGDGKTNRTE